MNFATEAAVFCDQNIDISHLLTGYRQAQDELRVRKKQLQEKQRKRKTIMLVQQSGHYFVHSVRFLKNIFHLPFL